MLKRKCEFMDILKARSEMMYGKTIYDMDLRVVDYGRVSTEKDEQINSLGNQINYFKEMISSVKTWKHVDSFIDEGISGTQVFKREEFLRMINEAKLGKFDLILTKEVSRFARNTIDSISYTQQLLKYGVIVYFMSDNINTIYPDSEFRLTLMASMAQDEVRKLSERVKFGIKRSIKERRVVGGGIYGYIKNDGRLLINEEEATAIKLLYSLYISGEYGFKKIGELLAQKGYFTRKGKIFSAPTLKKMLKNPKYKGFYTANLSEVEDYKTHKKRYKPQEEWIMEKDKKGNIPAIVSEDLWNKANKIYEKNYNKWNKNVLNKEFYLEEKKYTSKIYCVEHNKTFIRSANGKRKNNPVWHCNEYLRHGIKGCVSPRLFEYHLDELFTNLISTFIENKSKLLTTIISDYVVLLKDNNEISKIKNILCEQKNYKSRLIDLALKQIISVEDFYEQNKKITQEIECLQNDITKLKKEHFSADYYEIYTKKLMTELNPQLNIKNNIGRYFDLFINKVLISKINGNRNHIKIEIEFNFKMENKEYEIDFNKI